MSSMALVLSLFKIFLISLTVKRLNDWNVKTEMIKMGLFNSTAFY